MPLASLGNKGENAYANKIGAFLEFYHVPSGHSVFFKAFLTNFEDAYTANWAPENVYGRMDPINTFTNTTRQITVGWVIPSSDEEEARDNLRKLSFLAEMLYPSYEPRGNATIAGVNALSISTSPLMKVKFMNLIQSATANGGDASVAGLLCTMGGVSIKPNMAVGFFDKVNKLYPKEFELNAVLGILHTHPVGWGRDNFMVTQYPYGETTTTTPGTEMEEASQETNVHCQTIGQICRIDKWEIKWQDIPHEKKLEAWQFRDKG